MTAIASRIDTEIAFFDYQKHMRGVWSIERMQFKEQAMPREELRICMADRKNAGRVLLCRGEVVGFIIERFHTWHVEILTIAIEPTFERFGFGRRLVDDCFGRARKGGVRHKISAMVSERNLSAQLFLAACGFQWCHTVPGGFDVAGQSNDGYQFIRNVT